VLTRQKNAFSSRLNPTVTLNCDPVNRKLEASILVPKCTGAES